MRTGYEKSLLKMCVFLLIPMFFLIIPTSSLERLPSICLIAPLIGKPCPGCGMTRAISSLLHGDPRAAFHFNSNVIIVLPLLSIVYLRTLLRSMNNLKNQKNLKSPLGTDQQLEITSSGE